MQAQTNRNKHASYFVKSGGLKRENHWRTNRTFTYILQQKNNVIHFEYFYIK